jgi:hypothetical protein
MPVQLGGGGGGFPPLVDVTCKFWDEDVALPGFGFLTATAKVPADVSLPVAVSCVEETKLVASGAPARRTCAPLTNPAPFTVIAKAPAGTDVGAMPATTGTGFCKVTALLPVALASAELTARTLTLFETGIVGGAEYIPDELIVPVATLPPVTPFTCQLTAEFVDPATVARNDCVAPALTLALCGETETVMLAPEGGVLEFPPEFELEAFPLLVAPVQPASADAARTSAIDGAYRAANFCNLSI